MPIVIAPYSLDTELTGLLRKSRIIDWQKRESARQECATW